MTRLFGTDGVRGPVGETLTPELALALDALGETDCAAGVVASIPFAPEITVQLQNDGMMATRKLTINR